MPRARVPLARRASSTASNRGSSIAVRCAFVNQPRAEFRRRAVEVRVAEQIAAFLPVRLRVERHADPSAIPDVWRPVVAFRRHEAFPSAGRRRKPKRGARVVMMVVGEHRERLIAYGERRHPVTRPFGHLRKRERDPANAREGPRRGRHDRYAPGDDARVEKPSTIHIMRFVRLVAVAADDVAEMRYRFASRTAFECRRAMAVLRD